MTPPTTLQLFPDRKEKNLIENTQFCGADTFGERGSQFIALATQVQAVN